MKQSMLGLCMFFILILCIMTICEHKDVKHIVRKKTIENLSNGKNCKAINPVTTDDWCNSNCNASNPYCPSNYCSCDGDEQSSSTSSTLSFNADVTISNENSDGNLAYGGGTFWNGEVTNIAAWGSEANSNNGFQNQETYNWGYFDINNNVAERKFEK